MASVREKRHNLPQVPTRKGENGIQEVEIKSERRKWNRKGGNEIRKVEMKSKKWE